MKTRNKILVASIGIFLLAAGCNKQQPASSSVGQQNTQTVQQDNSAESQQGQSNTATSTTPSPIGMTQTRNNAGKPDYTPGYIVVTQTVEGSNLNQAYNKIKDGQTAEDLLKATHKVEVKAYSFGDMITSIDDNKADTQHFWEFFVNGKSSNVGAGSYKPKDGDKIEWKLTKISSSGQ
jgi:hypothetical protein